MEWERAEAPEPDSAPPAALVAIDGTGVPGRPGEVAGGRGTDGTAETREAKVIRPFGVRRGRKTGKARTVDGSVSQGAETDSAGVAPDGGTMSDFAARPERGMRRRGMFDRRESAVLSDGAAWVPNSVLSALPAERAVFILGLRHAPEKLPDALKATVVDADGRRAEHARLKAMVGDGRAREVAGEPAPLADRAEEVA